MDARPFDLLLVMESCSQKISQEHARRAEMVLCRGLNWNLAQKTPENIAMFMLEQFAASKVKNSGSLKAEVIVYLQEFLKIALADCSIAAKCSLVSVAIAAIVCIYDVCGANDSVDCFIEFCSRGIYLEIDQVNFIRILILTQVGIELQREGNNQLSEYLSEQTKIPLLLNKKEFCLIDNTAESFHIKRDQHKQVSDHSTNCSLDYRYSRTSMDSQVNDTCPEMQMAEEEHENNQLSYRSEPKKPIKEPKKRTRYIKSVSKDPTSSRTEPQGVISKEMCL
jgi:hypothetical protein